jgi:hypothetical protein
MTSRKRFAVSLAVLALLAGNAFGKDLPNIDAFGTKPKPTNRPSLEQKAGNLLRPGMRIQQESRLGVPTFLWANQLTELSGRPQGQGAERAEIGSARGHLAAVASLYDLDSTDITSAIAETVINTGRGPVIVKFSQQANGVDIFREEVNVVMNQKLEAIAITGYISSQGTPSARPGSSWTLPAAAAATDALRDAAPGNLGSAQLVKSFSRDGYDFYTMASPVAGVALEEPVRMKRVYFHLPEGLVPAYYVEVQTSNATGEVMLDSQMDESAYMYVISAVDGSILFRKNLVSEAAANTPPQNSLAPGGFTYRVWADPATGIPYDTPAGNGVHPKLVPLPDGAQHTFVAPNDVQLPNFPFSMNDPWLAPGATQTDGNNVDAFVNLFSPDGIGTPTTTTPLDPVNGDHRAQITAADQFLHTHQPDVDGYSVSARSGSITQLFYNINFLHDWYYDSGFNETARNGQKNNFGRGGLQNDDMKGQAQDFQSFSNANMLTPADGARSRMRMYNFPNLANTLDVQSPAGVGKFRIGVSQTGLRNFDVTGNVVIATFTAGPSTCTITNAAALAGNIAMFDFDNTDGTGCSFSTRIARIHATSAAAALMVYTSGAATLVANITGINATHTKGIGVISWNSGQTIKAQLAVPNTVTARLLRKADRDGSLDNQIVFHEWGHFISNRLIGNAAGLNNQQGGGMGEGWGDFNAMMLTVRESDTAVPSNANWGGVYALATYATSGVPYDGSTNHGYYLGIRRTPYSTDMANYNALTFRHIEDGQALPVGPPIATGGVNSEVHNTGEVWTTMMWECYASLLRDTLGPTPRLTFQQAQDRMKQYFVASLAMTPNSPTFLEARDAVLAAAYATDSTDYILFWQAFAKRGAGMNAVAPDRFSATNTGVVESYDVIPNLIFTGTSLNDSVASCDNDGSLDSGEAGKLIVNIKNVGSQSLSGTVATITSASTGITFPAGNTINFPSSEPLDTVTGSVTVAYAAGIAGIQQVDFHIEVSDPAVTGLRTQDPGFRANVNSIPASTATDTVEATATPWTLDSDITLSQVNPWNRQIVVPLDREWHVDNAGATSDQRLVSPVFTVDGSGSVNVQFDHTWSFEFDASLNYDGGVVEMSVNGGAWTDIGAPAYNGTIGTYSGDLNPLRTRPGFVKTGSAHSSLTQAIAPGSTVRIRFRFGSDNGVGAPGWNVDNIAFTGVVETPFGTAVADPGCAVATSIALTTSANPSPFGSPLTLTATVSATSGTPTGNVTFFDGATNLGTVALAGGVATLNTSALTVGAHSLTASYAGATGFLTSNSAVYAQTISKIATTLGLISSANPSNIGSPVTFTATVTAPTGTPTGSVSFFDGATPLGTVATSGGVAAFTTSSLIGGNHTINATYGGTSTYAGSSNSVAQVVSTGSTIAFNPTAYWKLEDGGNVTLTVTRTGGNTTGAASVQYATSNGTAIAGVRYTTSTGTVNFAGGETSKTFDIPLVDGSAIEGKQTFTVTLSNANAAVLGAAVATVNVMDDDAAESDFSNPSNGSTDIVWRNETTGDTRAWEMNGTTFVSSTNLLQFGGNWRLATVADFNADGHADIMYRNTVDFTTVIWYMNGTTLLTTAAGPTVPDANWQIVAAGDLNGDGFPDLVWRNMSSFAMAAWLMRDNVLLSVSSLPTVPDANWQMKGLGDFNRDGKLDMVWRNESAFTAAVWLMNGTTFGSAVALPSVGAPWNLVGVGDMNADGDSDLIWRTTSGSNAAVWLMNQTTLGTAGPINTIADPAWQIVAPR